MAGRGVVSGHAWRLVAGALVLVGAGWLLPVLAQRTGLGAVFSTPAFFALSWGVASFLGALVARTGFLPVALVLWVAVWKLVLFTLYRIAEPVGQASLLGLLQSNALAIVLGLSATIAGALLGQRAAARWQRRGGGPLAA